MSSSDDELDRAMAASSPISTPIRLSNQLGKRTRQELPSGSDDDEEEDQLSSAAGAPTLSSSVALATRTLKQFTGRITKKLKLRPEQVADLDKLIVCSSIERDIMVYAKLNALENQLQKVVTAQPEFKVSDHLDARIKKDRFDLPPNVERNPADWAKVMSHITYHQTQVRSNWKKGLRTSMDAKDPADHTDIFTLATSLTEGQCQVTVEFCAHLSVMRKVYTSDSDYWTKVDQKLRDIRALAEKKAAEAAGDGPVDPKEVQKRINKAMHHYLEKDRKKHGSEVEEIEEQPQDDYQQEIDDSIAAFGIN
ncbi:hypothetical protein JAAARDRAFT_49803 [Jaapia argillacea MUCL 33604]|uniref:Uncharacterized protein n=1 Tax=Jaapia argillacea MUCL 33604 TaxID=933084 RepID=A0A067PHH6_9AGAM|nr:hypothetical protein JAAARDRAFT_49803 [Jaapia argillacea MUCL 33604]